MTPEEIIYDIRTLLRQLHDDSSVKDAHILRKISNYRALFIKIDNEANKRLEDSWFQRLKLTSLTPVFSSDDPTIGFTTVKMGRCTLPTIIDLDMMASIRLTTASRMKEVYYKDFAMLREMIMADDYRLKIFDFYTKMGQNTYYFYPYHDRISPDLILDDPFDGYIFNTEFGDLANLSHGISYTVVDGTIKSLATSGTVDIETIYKKGETFIADGNLVYSGIGHVVLTTQITAFSETSNYPIGADIAQRIVMEILTKDFQLQMTKIVDVINDSMDALKLVYSEIGQGN